MNDKMNGRTQFTMREAKAIQAVFEGRTLDYLFEEKRMSTCVAAQMPKGETVTFSCWTWTVWSVLRRWQQHSLL